ncbi:hypothetical protein MHYP_G00167190 [Metynnis hypsauchen]
MDPVKSSLIHLLILALNAPHRSVTGPLGVLEAAEGESLPPLTDTARTPRAGGAVRSGGARAAAALALPIIFTDRSTESPQSTEEVSRPSAISTFPISFTLNERNWSRFCWKRRADSEITVQTVRPSSARAKTSSAPHSRRRCAASRLSAHLNRF